MSTAFAGYLFQVNLCIGRALCSYFRSKPINYIANSSVEPQVSTNLAYI